MIIPSIDLMAGQTVQLVGGKEKALDAGSPVPWAEKFGRVGEIAVIDLDAAMRQGSNADLIKEVLPIARCRVGGGIRDVETGLQWLNAGAAKIILGTAAKPEILQQFPKDRVIAALDAVHGEVVVEGWKQGTGRNVVERMEELIPYVSGFLVTFVEREGQLKGIDMEEVARLKKAAGDTQLTIAGGVATPEEVGELDRMGVDAQVGMALYTGKFDLADAMGACLKSDRPDGLWPTVITDPVGVALGLAYSSQESLREALVRGVGAYQSRSRGLWVKGMTSGATQKLLRVDMDCDRDTLRFVVGQESPGFCHKDTWTCWGADWGIPRLERVLQQRRSQAPEGSYTQRLFEDSALLEAKLREEVEELIAASDEKGVAWEAADVLYFTMVRMIQQGVSLQDVGKELDRRALNVTRRKGDAKPGALTESFKSKEGGN
ncbi:MAG: phosphoribosyl-ATP diphosphatase [Deltaproteobacteria bacterium]|nr:MAG: phosphoribosyl-ATP diphosphatase [Deltaproteobacteria bacterium]